MTMMNRHIQGAKVQSWNHTNPRDLLRTVIDKNPRLGRNAVFSKFKSQLNRSKNHKALLACIVEYWFANNYHSLVALPASMVEERIVHHRKLIEEVKTKIRERLLDMQLPNGLTLAESTFGYVAKLGGGLARIGVAGKPNQIVGDVLSEAKIKKLYGKRA